MLAKKKTYTYKEMVRMCQACVYLWMWHELETDSPDALDDWVAKRVALELKDGHGQNTMNPNLVPGVRPKQHYRRKSLLEWIFG